MAGDAHSLIACPSCGEMISKTAKACPKCGNARSLKDRMSKSQMVCFMAFFIGVVLVVHPDGSDGGGLAIAVPAIAYYLWSFRRK